MRDELPGVFDEVGEQSEFRRSQADVLAAESDPVVVEIDDEVSMLEAARPFRRGRGGPTQRRLRPAR